MSKYSDAAPMYGEWKYDPILQKYKVCIGGGGGVGATVTRAPSMQEILYESAIVLASGKDGELIISEECKEILRRIGSK